MILVTNQMECQKIWKYVRILTSINDFIKELKSALNNASKYDTSLQITYATFESICKLNLAF